MPARAQKLLTWIPGLLAIVWFIYEFRPYNGTIGHDYSHQMVRFLIGAAHFWQNGFSVQHYTSALCGGIGAFADPQSAYYSIPQWLSFAMDPWLAVRITIFGLYFFGYWAFVRLAKNRFNLSEAFSHFGALLFITNGFIYANLYVGHLTHHSYFFLPLFLDLLLRPYRSRNEQLGGASQLALLLTYMLYSGGLHMFMVFGVSALLLLPYWFERRIEEKTLVPAIVTCSAGALLFLCAAAAKLYAVKAYTPLFVIRGMDLSEDSPIAIWFRYFWFIPANTPPLIRFGEFAFGAWEYIGFMSKVTLPLLVFFTYSYFKTASLNARITAVISLLLILEVALLAVGEGGNEFLPGFSSYHNPIKIMASFIPFIALLSALALSRLKLLLTDYSAGALKWMYAALVAVVLVEMPVYSTYFSKDGVGSGFAYSKEFYQAVKKHGRLPQTKQIVDAGYDDQLAISAAGSKLHCYEPLFGYRGENLGNNLLLGPVTDMRDGAFNLTHPGCLIYPEYFQCNRWDRIPASQAEDFVKFTSGQTTSWGVPPTQTVLQWLTLVTVLICLAAWLLSVFRSFKLKS